MNNSKASRLTTQDDIFDNTAFLITDVARRYRTNFDERIQHLHLLRSEWWLLSHLHFFEGSTQQELCDVMDITKGGMGKLIDRLETNGLVVRQTDESDRRTRRVFLAPKAKSLVNELQAFSKQVEAEALTAFKPAELRTFNRLLKKLRANFLNNESVSNFED